MRESLIELALLDKKLGKRSVIRDLSHFVASRFTEGQCSFATFYGLYYSSRSKSNLAVPCIGGQRGLEWPKAASLLGGIRHNPRRRWRSWVIYGRTIRWRVETWIVRGEPRAPRVGSGAGVREKTVLLNPLPTHCSRGPCGREIPIRSHSAILVERILRSVGEIRTAEEPATCTTGNNCIFRG